jgi:pimeloyl-ACP methyl ester carboxylesterase
MVALGALYQSMATARDAEDYAPLGELVDVGGHRLHIHCTGAGSPTVVFEAGAGGGALDWTFVQNEVATFTRTCSYDRVGLGWSDWNEGRQGSRAVAEDLHTLLANAATPGPYVLVGHSLGGIHVRTFAQLYPADVVGMALVESAHENQSIRMGEMAQADPGLTRLLTICRLVAPFGVFRLFKVANTFTTGIPFTEHQRAAMVATMNRTGFCRGVAAEFAHGAVETSRPDPPIPLGDLPLVVLTAGESTSDSIWNELQVELTRLSTNSVHLTADSSGHYIQLFQPSAVIEAVRRLTAN